MIAQLTGKPKSFTANSIILNVRGVGYHVYLPPTAVSRLLKLPQITLFIHTHVRDDALDLYGFQSLEALQLFKLIISISGIGPKIALALVNQGVDHITAAVSKADVDFFTSIPRLGKKNAQKIIIELKPKLGSLQELDLTGETPENQQALDALINLGFSRQEARQALKQIAKPGDSLEQRIAKAIKQLGKPR